MIGAAESASGAGTTAAAAAGSLAGLDAVLVAFGFLVRGARGLGAAAANTVNLPA